MSTNAGINFDRATFGQPAAAGSAKEKQPAAKLWLNVGYQVEYPVEGGGTETRLVSLPIGIPVDTQKHLKAGSSNATYSKFLDARNNLLDQIVAAGNALEDGGSQVLNLTVEIRKVKAESAPDVDPASNEFIQPIKF